MHSDTIWNNLEIKWTFWKQFEVAKVCLMTLFGNDNWNCNKKNNTYCFVLKHVRNPCQNITDEGNLLEILKNRDSKWCNLAVFETFWNCREKKENRDGKWRILTLLNTICSYREHFENKDGTWCNLTVFETVWNFHEKIKRTLNGAFWWHWEQFGNAENF